MKCCKKFIPLLCQLLCDVVVYPSEKALKKNVLIIGHSNTIDDLANTLCGEKKVPTDFAETDYNNLLIVKIKKKKILFEHKTYGTITQ